MGSRPPLLSQTFGTVEHKIGKKENKTGIHRPVITSTRWDKVSSNFFVKNHLENFLLK